MFQWSGFFLQNYSPEMADVSDGRIRAASGYGVGSRTSCLPQTASRGLREFLASNQRKMRRAGGAMADATDRSRPLDFFS